MPRIEANVEVLVDFVTSEFVTVAEREILALATRMSLGADAARLAFSVTFKRTEMGEIEIQTSSGASVKVLTDARKARIQDGQLSML